jgi:hypothetical protein
MVPAGQIGRWPVGMTVMLTGQCRSMLQERCREIAR